MRRETVYSMKSLYRGDFTVESFTFGAGSRKEHPEKSIAVLGALRGDEVQQLYIAGQLVRYLRQLEEAGLIDPQAEICVIPCGNAFSLNTKTRFWAVDNTDINRMFPGYDKGETTQRIAAGIFDVLQDFGYGVQLASYYLPGEFVPHVRVMNTGYEDVRLAEDFGLPYAVLHEPEPVDSGTLNYNWQIWNAKAVSIFSRKTVQVDAKAADVVIFAILRFMMKKGIISYDLHPGYHTQVVKEEHLVNVRTATSGIVQMKVQVGDHVRRGQHIATIWDPLTGSVRAEVESPVMGVVFFSSAEPLMSQDSILYRIIDDKIVA